MYSKRSFGVLPKLPKVELTVRTPYKTLFENYNSFSRIYVHTLKGLMAIGNKSIPRVYLLPPGQLTVKGMFEGEGKNTETDSGEFMHSGGWLFVHENNSIDVNLLEIIEKEDFQFDKVGGSHGLETSSPAGVIAEQLQTASEKLIQRQR